MIEFENKTDLEFNEKELYEIYSLLTDKDVEVIITDDEEIKELNFKFRNKNSPTDVLSFPLQQMPSMPLGSIVISADTAMRAAKRLGHGVEDEIKVLFLHGLLHLLGYDHETDSGEMRNKEEEIIKKLKLPPSLIVRED